LTAQECGILAEVDALTLNKSSQYDDTELDHWRHGFFEFFEDELLSDDLFT